MYHHFNSLTLFSLPVSFCCPELLISSRDEPLLKLAQERSCWNDHRGDMSEAYHGGKLRCYVHIMDQGLCYRVNTLAAYIEANRLVSRTLACSFRGFCEIQMCMFGGNSVVSANLDKALISLYINYENCKD